MVSLNITLFIELGLFLIFLWGTARFILRPVLHTLDERDQTVESNLADATREDEHANKLEEQYIRDLSEARRQTDETFQQSRRETLKGHTDAVRNARAWADETVAEARLRASELAENQRADLLQSIPEIAELLARQLHPGGPQS